jgi:uncharacterized membrane protein YfcA
MSIYLPIAELPVNVYFILVLGLLGGILSGLFGIGGGFLITPILIFLGIPPSVAVATSSNQIVATSASAFFNYKNQDKVDIKMGSVMLIGGVIGGYLGVMVFKSLSLAGLIDFVIALIYVCFLTIVSAMMFIDGYKKLALSKIPSNRIIPHDNILEEKSKRFIEHLPFKTFFPKSKVSVSVLVPIAIGIVAGLLASLMGIGGGIVMVPAMIYLLKIPTKMVIGTSLYQILLTGAVVTLLHSVINNAVDIVLALLLIVGGVIGAQIGVRLADKTSQGISRIFLAVIFMIIGLRLSIDLFIKPYQIFTISNI